uniref:Protein kinase domain-containing protein n=1 Tax=Meloidogyne enterolobii TaxID=390850 RepID=A0A6V7UY33_MELEN|nr:unnamed protein product [Meloidogyne enterolobii]
MSIFNNKCCCGKYKINSLEENKTLSPLNQNSLNEQESIKLIFNFEHKLGSSQSEFRDNTVYHAYWKNGNKCVALKVSRYDTPERKRFIKRELHVLQHFARVPIHDKDRIINMIGSQLIEETLTTLNGQESRTNFMYFALELGGKDLHSYFVEKTKKRGVNKEEFLIKIARGSALSIKQFHRHGIHLDIKANNFIVSLQQNNFKKEIKLKLIDFNTSVITSNAEISTKVHGLKKFRAPEIRGENPQGFKVNRKVDIWAFGLMIYGLYKKKGDEEQPNDRELINSVRMSLGDYTELDNELREYLSNTESNSFLDRVIKGCLQLEVDIRPSINAIVDFLNEECNGFEYEREFLNNEDIKWCNEN